MRRRITKVLSVIIWVSIVCAYFDDRAFALVTMTKKGGVPLSDPHKNRIEFTKREEIISNESLLRSVCQGPGSTTVNFTGSFSGTVRTTGGIQVGGMIYFATLNASIGSDTSKSISMSQSYTINMPDRKEYIVVARPIYEYSEFNIVHRNTKTGRTKIVDRGYSERLIGLKWDSFSPSSEKMISSSPKNPITKGEAVRMMYYNRLGIV